MNNRLSITLEAVAIILIITILGWTIIPMFLAAQNTNTPENFPDPAFRAAVEKFMGVEPGGVFTKTQVAEQTGTLNCSNMNVTNTIGLEYLKSVTKIEANDNNLKSINLSNQTLLESINLDNNQLTSLDVTKSPKLYDLFLSDNQISNIDLSQNHDLKRLMSMSGQLTSIDVTKNTKLYSLQIMGHQIKQFPDLSNNTELGVVDLRLNNIGCDSLPAIKAFKKSFEAKSDYSFQYSQQNGLELDECSAIN